MGLMLRDESLTLTLQLFSEYTILKLESFRGSANDFDDGVNVPDMKHA